MNSTYIPNYTIKANLSVPMLQCMTFLAVANQSVSSDLRYDKLSLPVP